MDSTEVVGSKARLDIFGELSRRNMYVSELMEVVGMDGKVASFAFPNRNLRAGDVEGTVSPTRITEYLRRET